MVREMTERSESPCFIFLSLHGDSASWKQSGWRWQGDDSPNDLWSDHALVTVKVEKTWLPKQQILCHSENLLCANKKRTLWGERINGWTQFTTLGKMCNPEYLQVAIIFFYYSLLDNLLKESWLNVWLLICLKNTKPWEHRILSSLLNPCLSPSLSDKLKLFFRFCCCSVAPLCPALGDPMDCSMPVRLWVRMNLLLRKSFSWDDILENANYS